MPPARDDPWPGSLSLPYVEGLYADFVRDPASVPEAWRQRFAGLERDAFSRTPRLRPSFAPPALFDPTRGRNGS